MSESLVPAPVHSLAPRFDYAGLDQLAAKAVQDAADRIRARESSMRRDVIETGRDLIDVKKQLDHGEFLRWLVAEFNWSERSAQNYMAAAQLVAKSATVADLPMKTLYRLASPSTPDIARDTIIDRLERGETVTTKDIRNEIDRRRCEEAEADRLAKLSPEARKREKSQREKRDRKFAEQRAASQKMEEDEEHAALEAIAFLQERLGDEDFRALAKLIERSSGWRFANEMRKELEARP